MERDFCFAFGYLVERFDSIGDAFIGDVRIEVEEKFGIRLRSTLYIEKKSHCYYVMGMFC